ncbi:MAG: hypothetical protein ACREKL_11185 [Chthoniobacterales bacterium]
MFPMTAMPADLTHWQTAVHYSDLGDVAAISLAKSVTLPASSPWHGQGQLVRDPDGHTLFLNQP